MTPENPLLEKLQRLYKDNGVKPDELGRRPALPSEIQRVIRPATTPEVKHQIRHTPAWKPGTKDGK